jgi:hypothetical protein
MATPAGRSRARPGDGVVSGVVLGALIVLVLNDHWLKAAWPGLVTGKLSDVAGLMLTPLVLQAVWEIGQWIAGRWRGPSSRALLMAILATGAGFTAIKVSAPVNAVWEGLLGVAQWVVATPAALLTGSPAGPVSVASLADPTDLLALPVLAVSWMTGRRRTMLLDPDRDAASARLTTGRPRSA